MTQAFSQVQPVSGMAVSPPSPYSRYSDQPMDWRTRAAGMGGTTLVALAIAFCLFVTWRVVQPMVASPTIIAINLKSYEAPPETVREVPEGREQVEQVEQKLAVEPPPEMPPQINVPRLSPVMLPAPAPAEPVAAAEPVTETTAPRSLPARPSNRVSSDTDATWEALVLAHLERHRRYPTRARAARQQGVVHVRFTMNRAGVVLSSKVQQGSGHFTLDQAALDTLRRSEPLPAIPPEKPGTIELTVPVAFFITR